MWSDLRQFDKATKWAAQAGVGGQQAVSSLLQKQAQWNEEVRDYRAAADMYMNAGKHDTAVLLLSKHTQDWAHLLEIARKLDRCGSARLRWDDSPWSQVDVVLMNGPGVLQGN